jgi:hypothetical protein
VRPEALRHISVSGLAAHLGIALHFCRGEF